MQTGIVYCIVVTYNGTLWIEKCLDSLIASSCKNQIIVIDNGSEDLTVSLIKENYPDVWLIQTGKNLGFGQANNIGLTKVIEDNAEYAFLLNQDAWVDHDTIFNLVKAQKENPGYGILSPVHLNNTGNNFDEYFYDYFIKSGIKELLMSVILNKKISQVILNVPFVNAAAWLISRECIKKTGGFDPIFFHYGEDNNYAHRALSKGFKFGILITAKMYHDRERITSKKTQDIKAKFKKDWIIFLTQACNIQQSNYIILIIGRFLRYSLFGFAGILTFNREKVFYNFSMVKNIIFSFSKIRQSRLRSKNNKFPYLFIEKANKKQILA